MTETPPPQSAPPDSGFDPARMRTVTRMQRSRDDRMIAGVCGGLARYLDIDPVVVRVIVASLTVVGGAGLILYLAAWLLVPEEGSGSSAVAEQLPTGRERQVRTVGFAIAAVLVVLAFASTGPWSGWRFPWPLLAVAFVAWLLFRPDRRSTRLDTASGEAAEQMTAGAPAPPRSRGPARGDGSLALMTVGVVLIAAGVLWLVVRATALVEWPDYVALSLALVGLGTLVGTWLGDARRLLPVGVLLVLVLLASAQLPTLNAGDVSVTPRSAAELESDYTLGAGEMHLDLTRMADIAELDGRTVSIDNGMGKIRVIVPDDVDVSVDAHVDLGHLQVFTRDVGGWNSNVLWRDLDDTDPDLHLVFEQSAGEIKVMRR